MSDAEPTDAHQTGDIRCPHCGAPNARWDELCWVCRQPFQATGAPDDTLLAEAIAERPQFGLSTLLLVMTVICVCLGLMAFAPGLSIPLLLIVVPALFRTAAANRASAQPLSISSKIANFLLSIGLIVLIWVAGLVALAIACTTLVLGGAATQFDDHVVWLLFVLAFGAIAAVLGFMGWLYKITWPRRNRK